MSNKATELCSIHGIKIIFFHYRQDYLKISTTLENDFKGFKQYKNHLLLPGKIKITTLHSTTDLKRFKRFKFKEIRYEDGTHIYLANKRGTFHVFTLWSDETAAATHIYLMILSLVGELLEKNGFIRVHALSFSYLNKGYLLHFRSGMGKSTLALMLNEMDQVNLHSEEICLLKNMNIYSFPVRVALSEESSRLLGIDPASLRTFQQLPYKKKYIVPFPARNHESTNLNFYFYGVNTNKNPQIAKNGISFWLYLKFVFDFTIGKDLPQMIEFALRWDSVLFLMSMLYNRLITSLRIIKLNHLYVFYVNTNAITNLSCLNNFLSGLEK